MNASVYCSDSSMQNPICIFLDFLFVCVFLSFCSRSHLNLKISEEGLTAASLCCLLGGAAFGTLTACECNWEWLRSNVKLSWAFLLC